MARHFFEFKDTLSKALAERMRLASGYEEEALVAVEAFASSEGRDAVRQHMSQIFAHMRHMVAPVRAENMVQENVLHEESACLALLGFDALTGSRHYACWGFLRQYLEGARKRWKAIAKAHRKTLGLTFFLNSECKKTNLRVPPKFPLPMQKNNIFRALYAISNYQIACV